MFKLDKLSVLPGLNCFEAISGVYTGLRRIFECEKRRLREVRIENGYMDDDIRGDEVLEREVMCKKSGRPRMHAGRRVGLRLDYWMERRHVHSKGYKAAPGDPSATGAEPASDSESDDGQQIWSAIIECESSPAELYPSVRVSDNWVSEKAMGSQNQDDLFGSSTEPTIEWLDPSPTYLPQGDSMDMGNAPESLGKLPDVRFIARLEPPVVLPLDTAVSIYGAVGAAIPEHSIMPTTYDGLLLPTEPSENQRPFGEPRELSKERTLYVRDENGDMVERRHRYNLYVEKRAFGRLVEEIPFSHPRQLVEILPASSTHVFIYHR
jgi:Mediator of RNA polymerase II transcription subunit 1